jgi:Ran GTPase-activating protein (RanGAP) involved in mRNA processing and transport
LTETKSLRKLRVAMAGFTLDREAAVDMATGFACNTTLRDIELICCNAPNIPLVLEGLHNHSTLRTLILDRLASLTGLDTLLQQQRNHAISDLHISRYTADGHGLFLPSLEKLARAMQRNTTVTKLTISQSRIGHNQAKQLRIMFPRNQTLKSLNLVGNILNSEALAELATGLYRNTSLEHLDVANNQLHDAAAVRILQALMRRNKSLIRMDIDRNTIGAANVGSIANGLRANVVLQDVDLSGSMLGDTGIEVLVRGLRQNSTLQTLALCDNGITATGVHELVNLLIGSTGGITDLVLNCNPIGYEGVNMLANALGQNVIGQLIRLYLDACTLGDDCLTALASAIERNDTLTLLSMEDNEFGTRGLLALASSLPEMKALQRIDFTWNASVATTMASFLAGFRENSSLLHVNIPGSESGEWMTTMKFLSARNHFFPLLLAKDGDELPLGIWPHALATAAADPDVLLYNLCAKPGLVEAAVKTLKRAAGSHINQAAGDSKKQKHGQVE